MKTLCLLITLQTNISILISLDVLPIKKAQTSAIPESETISQFWMDDC